MLDRSHTDELREAKEDASSMIRWEWAGETEDWGCRRRTMQSSTRPVSVWRVLHSRGHSGLVLPLVHGDSVAK